MELYELSPLILNPVSASRAERITGMKTGDQRKKRLRKQLSPISSGKRKRASLGIFDLAEMMIVQQMASLGIASHEAMLHLRREAARYIGYWALCQPGAVERPHEIWQHMVEVRSVEAGFAFYGEDRADMILGHIPKYMFFWNDNTKQRYSFSDIANPYEIRFEKSGRNFFKGRKDSLVDELENTINPELIKNSYPYIAFPLEAIGRELAQKFGVPLAQLHRLENDQPGTPLAAVVLDG